jgi:hypothetical protein
LFWSLRACSRAFDPRPGPEKRREAFLHPAEEGIDGGSIMLWTIIGILVVLWLVGFVAHIGGGLIHLLLVIALIVFVVNLLTGRSTV